MVWSVYARPLESGDLNSTNQFQPLIMPSDTVVRAFRTWIVYYGDPTFTNLKMKIYANDTADDTPTVVIATSTNSYNLADIKETYSYGIKEIYFQFSDVALKGADKYHLVLAADTYSPTTDVSYLSWRVAWPDPVYDKNFTVSGTNFLTAPFSITGVVGSGV